MRIALVTTVLAATLACGGSSTPETTEPACDLSLENLPGQTFVMLEIKGDKSEAPNPRARVKFVREEGKLLAKYTVSSLERIYDFECSSLSDNEVRCTSEPKLAEMCISLEVHKEGSCSADALKAMDVSFSDEAFAEGKKKAMEHIAKAKEAGQMAQLKALYNNVGQPYMGLLYAKVDSRHCRLTVDDMYMTIYNGKKTEDFNPVGTNAFVQTDEDYLFTDCPNARVLLAWKEAEVPSSLDGIDPFQTYSKDQEAHYIYVGNQETKAEEGCTYSADLWVNWKEAASGVAQEPVDGVVKWHVPYTFTGDENVALEPGKDGAIVTMTRTKTCGGKATDLDAVCAMTIVQ